MVVPRKSAHVPGKAIAKGITTVAIAATLTACATGESASRAGDSTTTGTISSSGQPANPSSAQPSTQACAVDYSPVTIPVGSTFGDGAWLKDAFSGQRVQVHQGEVTIAATRGSEGVILLEREEPEQGQFSWAGATVYFALTDRFANGNPANDNAYGRQPDGEREIGTFHGGDFAGLTEKLDYIAALGVDALWISPPVEQIHGWVGGGDQGDFRHYGYHGYYGLDFTVPDASYGSEAEFKTLVDEAHKRNIRVVMDVVLNHPGYSTLQDMQDFKFGALFEGFEQYLPEHWGNWQPESWEDLHAYHALIDYDNTNAWANWWGKDWVRAGIADYDSPPSATIDPLRGSLAFLPDFKTESDNPVDLPTFLAGKPDTRARQLNNATVRDYLIAWQTGWVRRYGIDGFRVDTAKHVEPATWKALKTAGQQALNDYRERHTGAALPAADFWMVGEVFPHVVTRSHYFDDGFDAVINFDFQKQAQSGAQCLPAMEEIYQQYANSLHGDVPFNVMSYISSHDTSLFSSETTNDPLLQKRVAAALLLAPGTVQIFYGDESARVAGHSGSDPQQGTRSDMNWNAINSGETDALIEYWQVLGQFRQRHPAIGAGQHQLLSERPYAFSRHQGEDQVIVVFTRK
ncbi:alpha-amylase [Marinobacter sp. 1Y8]